MMNILVLGHSYVENLRRLCENRRKPHTWENPSNAHGKVSVQMHGYPGATFKRLTEAIEAGLFVHYSPHVVICQIGSNDCDRYSFDETAFRSDMNTFIYACLSRGVSVVFMSVMKRSGPWYCTPDEHTVRREIVNKMMKSIALENHFVHYFKPTNVYRVEYEARDGIHFTEEGYRAFLVALRKSVSWFINKVRK